ncbi:component of oligomeric golgi family complex 6 [Ophiostoma piceae UAMH 11346]|uniref:Conserved oligomeric Golgi complex subunit 6 n=1 Tax=Ophiostoma piceae (strain UAMH 11346) TaxID=1262450 RepID=S3BTA1_OPHP1|nr:component of oligomeric golgi family complex 6 [Ophiostoma piceae UAMH 11346]
MASETPSSLRLGAHDSLTSSSSSDSLTSSGILSPRLSSSSASASALKGLNNPLASKITSVLSASYADAEFRDSLGLLDGRNAQNNAETRRRLRLDVQKEVIDSNGEVIAEFGRVAEQLRRIGSTIERLNKTYDAMKTEITAAHTATAPVLEEASVLIDRRRNIETRRKLLGAFVGHFVLSEDEMASLTQTAEPVDDRFFGVLKKAKKISKDCEVLLGFESNQSLGSEIMEQTTRNINLGYQKLYKWVQREFKHLNLENPQIGSAMSRALRVLAERPTMFQSCLDAFAEARESILSDSFYVALTGNEASSAAGGRNGASSAAATSNRRALAQGVKPIEMAAHDPLRYAGDMLAWTHSATVSEREALETLFVADGGEIARGLKEGRENEVWRLADDEGENSDTAAFDPIEALNRLVDRDLAGVARLLRQRMQQVIQTNEETILAFKLANLLNFYRVTFSKLLGGSGSGGRKASIGNGTGGIGEAQGDSESSLVETLFSLEVEALRHFRLLIRDHVAVLQGEFSHAPTESAQPEFLQDALEQLVAVMKTYDTSLASPDSREPGFKPILEQALDPFLAGCDEMASKAANAVDSLVFTINCLMASRDTLSTFDFTTGRVAELQSAIDTKAAALADNQYGYLCEQSGVEALFGALAPLRASNQDDLKKALELDLLKPQALSLASQRLDDFLPSALMDAIENLKPLQDPKLARQLTEEAAEKFCVNFEHVEEILDAADALLRGDADKAESDDSDEDEQEPDVTLRRLFPRTTVEIRVLLS